jgi:hypothetical protein
MTTFTIEDNRIYAELPFIRPDGKIRNVRTFVDIGTPNMVISPALYRDLEAGHQDPLTFHVGDLPVEVKSTEVTTSSWFYGFREGTEAILPGAW